MDQFLEFAQINYRELTLTEENELYTRYKEYGDFSAYEELILAHLWVGIVMGRVVCRNNNIYMSPRHIEEAVNSTRLAVENFDLNGRLRDYVEVKVMESLQLMIDTESRRFIILPGR